MPTKHESRLSVSMGDRVRNYDVLQPPWAVYSPKTVHYKIPPAHTPDLSLCSGVREDTVRMARPVERLEARLRPSQRGLRRRET
jgi:hypothetical protein